MAEPVTSSQGGEDNYFVSMTDLMVGLLLIFIIMLMFFALQFKETIHEQEAIDNARSDILTEMKRLLEEDGVTVLLDLDQGVLRLPESVLFESGEAEFNSYGDSAIRALARSLERVLPCYTKGIRSTRMGCEGEPVLVDAVLIEGHTDDDPVRKSSRPWRDNLELSTRRATNTYRALLAAASGGGQNLLDFKNSIDVPVLSVSGYGEHRPIDKEEKAPNRRIDLRVLMEAAGSRALQESKAEFEGSGQ